MPDIKPCPFCGSEADVATVKYAPETVRKNHWSQDTFFYVSCIRCGADSCGVVGAKDVEMAILKWNTRVEREP
jgi:hypothetical protein